MVTAVVVTGASRGFGRAAAIALTAELSDKQKSVDVFLWARDTVKLQDVESAVLDAGKTYNANVRAFSSAVDLGSQASYVLQVESLVGQLQRQDPPYEAIYVVHNAASLGKMGNTVVWDSASELASYWELNLNHVCFLNARLLKAFAAGGHDAAAAITQLVLINISSGAAVDAYAGFGLYCTGKAARDMHMRVIAAENKDADNVRVLNYSPGAMDTDMQIDVRASTTLPAATHAIFVSFQESGQLVRAEDSALYCAQVVVEDAYESGSTLDYDSAKLVKRAGLFP